jgi:protein-L-isoaspartate O-methyltransferase
MLFGLRAFSSQKELVQYLREEVDLTDSRVIDAMSTIPRSAFLPDDIQKKAFVDMPLKIEPFGFPTS